MNSIDNKNAHPATRDVASEAAESTARTRVYVAPRLVRQEDLPAITAVQSCDFFSTGGCS